MSEKEFNFLDYLKRYRPGGPRLSHRGDRGAVRMCRVLANTLSLPVLVQLCQLSRHPSLRAAAAELPAE